MPACWRIDGLVIGAGPGSFTGALASMAQGLAFGADTRLPMCCLSIGTASHPKRCRWCGACIDARMGEVYYALYAMRTVAVAQSEPAVAKPDTTLLI